MNLGIVVHRFPPHIGGNELYAKRLAKELHRRGHDVTVFTTRDPDRGSFPYAVEEFRNVVPESFGYFAWPGVFAPSSLRKLRGLDAVHCINASMFSAVVGAFASRAFGTTAALTTTYHHPGVQTHQRLKRTYDRVVLQRLLPQYDRLVVSSEFEREHLEEHFDLRGCSISRFHIPPIVDRSVERTSNSGDDFTVLFVGRLDTHKGILTFLRAFERLSDRHTSVRCVVVGEQERWYEWPDEVTDVVEELDDGIEFRGFVEEDELAACYASADVLVMPSSYETFGQVVPEAMSYGTPVVSTPVGASPELINEGENGYLYDRGSVEELALRLEDVVVTDGVEMARHAEETVEGLTWESLVDDLLAIYGR